MTSAFNTHVRTSNAGGADGTLRVGGVAILFFFIVPTTRPHLVHLGDETVYSEKRNTKYMYGSASVYNAL